MNTCGSSAEQRGGPSWASESWDHPGSIGGLETRQYGGSRLDWEWENAMLMPQHTTSGGVNADEQDRKSQIAAGVMNPGLRIYDGLIPTALSGNSFPQHPVALLNSSGIRNFASMDASPSFPSFRGSLGSTPSISHVAAAGDSRSSAMDHRRHLFGIMSVQDQKGHLQDIMRREADACPGDGPARIGLNLGVRTYFSTEDTMAGRLMKRPRINSPGAQVPLCQAEGCKADLSAAKHYHRRHKVCEQHSKAASVIANGQTQRFCQQCSRFHVLAEFDDGKRSCRKRLADHNRRRRKPQPINTSTCMTTDESLALVEKDDHDRTGGTRTGHHAAAISNPDAQGLLSSISLSPVTLVNSKRQLPPLHGGSHEAVYPYLGQAGTHLSLSSLGAGLGLDSPSQQHQSVSQSYSSIEQPHVSWLKTAGSTRTDLTDSVQRSVNLHHLMSSKSDQNSGNSSSLQVFTPPMHNLMPSQSSREISNSDWMMSRKDSGQFDMHMTGSLEGQQALSLLEGPKPVRNQAHSTGQRATALEFLQQQPTLSSNDGDDSQSGSGNQSDMKFPELQALRPFESMYDSVQNIL